MKRFLSLALCLLMFAGMLAGCSSNTDTDPSTDDGTTTTTPDDENNSTGDETTPSGEENYKKDIIFGLGGKIVALDPQANSNTQHNYYFRMVFDTPLDFNNETQELEPNIVTEWSTEDAVTYSFTLRDDVYFHNGEQLTADDVKFSYDRAPDTDSASTLGDLIKETRVIDDFHFEIELHSANVDLPYLLTLPTASIINREAVTENELEGTGIGSGPWMVDSYEFGDYMKLVRNDNFWGEKAKAETFTLRYMPETSARLIALETGEIDICADPDPLDLERVRGTDGLELQSYVGTSITYFAMNYKKEPFNDQNLRLAMAYGINVQELIDVVRLGEAQPCLSLWGWNQYGYNGGTTPYEYDPEKAKEYLAAAGYSESNPFSFKLSVSAGERKSCGELIQAQLKEIGVNVEIVEFDTAGLSTSTTNGEHEACLYGCGMNIFGDDSRRLICPGTGVNKSHYDNAEVNELMDLAVAELDDTKRTEYYHEVQQILHDDGAYVPLYSSNGFFAVKEGTGGIDYYPTSHHDMSNVYIIEQ